MNGSTKTANTIIPVLLYRNAPAAIDWLCRVFGFEKHQVFENSDGMIAHAELKLNGGMVMLGSTEKTTEFSRHIKQPDEIGGFETRSSYLVVTDAVFARAVAAHAKIEIAIKDEDYGGRGFTCRDLEDPLWSVGTYDPWKQKID